MLSICKIVDSIEITCIQRTHTECEIDPSVCLNLNDENTESERISIRSYDNLKDTISLEILSPTNLTRIPSFILRKFPKLRHLRMINTGITSLSSDSFAAGHRLMQIDLRRNQIGSNVPTHVFANLNSLEDVNLAYNKISRIEPGAFNSVPALKILFLSNNMLPSIHSDDFAGAKNLQELFLDSNVIERIEENSLDLPNLEILSLKDNRLKSLPNKIFENSKKLEKIDLSHNGLVEIDDIFKNCDQLYSLSLNHNPNLKNADLFEITTKIPSLSYLYLANTGLRPFNEPKQTDPNYALTHLDLSSNNLSSPDIFTHLTQFKSLKTVVLNDNNFTFLNHMPVLKSLFPRLDSIHLKYNRHLKMDWLRDTQSVLQKQGIKLVTEHRQDQ